LRNERAINLASDQLTGELLDADELFKNHQRRYLREHADR